MTTIKAHTLSDFCRRYGVGRTKAYEEINAGRLKARKNGRSTIITEDDGQAWLDSLPTWSSVGVDLEVTLPPTTKPLSEADRRGPLSRPPVAAPEEKRQSTWGIWPDQLSKVKK